MWRMLGAIILGAGVCLMGISPAGADDQKTTIKGGIQGKVKTVDVAGKTLTITTADKRERTFTVTHDTTIVGPRGGKIPKRLKDPRFRRGFTVTVVAQGTTAEQIHLGFAKGGAAARGDHSGTETQATNSSKTPRKTGRTKGSHEPAQPTEDTPAAGTPSAGQSETTKPEDRDEQTIAGRISRFDATRRILVLRMQDGKTKSFLLPRTVVVQVKGATAASTKGLKDPQLKAGTTVNVVTDKGGRKVKQLIIVPAAQIKRQKAG